MFRGGWFDTIQLVLLRRAIIDEAEGRRRNEVSNFHLKKSGSSFLLFSEKEWAVDELIVREPNFHFCWDHLCTTE